MDGAVRNLGEEGGGVTEETGSLAWRERRSASKISGEVSAPL